METRLRSLPNIGAVLEQKLIAAGVQTPEQLRQAGSKQAWLAIRANDPTACLHMLLALAGAVRGLPKAQPPEEDKAALKAFVKSF